MYLFALIALAVGWYFADAAWRKPRPGLIIAAVAWLLYAVYEFLIGYGVLCDANCNIRVDTFLVWPLVWIAALFGLYAPGEWTSGGKVLAGSIVFLFVAMIAVFAYIYMFETPPPAKAAWAVE